jgi:hypothetical protein
VLQVFGEEIVPSSTYHVQAILDVCASSTGQDVNYSEPLAITTARWGDVALPFQEPSPATLSQPDFFDVSAVIDKWIGLDPAAPIVARADLHPGIPNQSLNYFDISTVIDAWKLAAYPFSISTTCP